MLTNKPDPERDLPSKSSANTPSSPEDPGFFDSLFDQIGKHASRVRDGVADFSDDVSDLLVNGWDATSDFLTDRLEDTLQLSSVLVGRILGFLNTYEPDKPSSKITKAKGIALDFVPVIGDVKDFLNAAHKREKAKELETSDPIQAKSLHDEARRECLEACTSTILYGAVTVTTFGLGAFALRGVRAVRITYRAMGWSRIPGKVTKFDTDVKTPVMDGLLKDKLVCDIMDEILDWVSEREKDLERGAQDKK